MSGIAGIVRFDGAPVAPGLVETMTGAMAHRGPDGIDHWVKGSAALGQCMLRTTPESLEEQQPLTNEDASLVLVMDGRVDNWEELRRELLARGAVLRNRSDAELVLRAYEVWGDECPDRIVGEVGSLSPRRDVIVNSDRVLVVVRAVQQQHRPRQILDVGLLLGAHDLPAFSSACRRRFSSTSTCHFSLALVVSTSSSKRSVMSGEMSATST